MAWKLADLFVQFSVSGVEAVKNSLTAVQAKLAEIAAGANAVGNAASTAFNRSTLVLGGWITAGVAASAQGQVLGFQMERLARTIAGVFGPEIQKAIDLVRKATEYISSLSNVQKANIVHWIEASLAGLAVAKVFPLVFSGIQTVVAGMAQLTIAVLSFNVASGNILPLIGGLLTAFAGLAVAAEVGQNGFGRIMAAVKPLMDVLSRLASTTLTALEPLFATLAEGAGKVFSALAPLIPAFASLAGTVAATLAGVLRPVFDTLAKVIVIFANAMRSILPAVEQVIAVLGNSLAGILTSLAPILVTIADLIGDLVVAFVPLAVTIAKTTAAILDKFRPFIDAMAVQLVAAAPRVADAMMRIAEATIRVADAFAPVILQLADLATGILPIMVTNLEGMIGLLNTVAFLAELAANNFENMANSIQKYLVPALKLAAPAMGGLIAFLAKGLEISRNMPKIEIPKLPPIATAQPGNRDMIPGRMGSGPEDVTTLYNRIAQASILATLGKKPVEEDQLDQQKAIKDFVERIWALLGLARPAAV